MSNKLLLGLLLPVALYAQQKAQPKNLVYNPSFEYYDANYYKGVSGHMSFSNDLAFWKSANKNTPDLKIYSEEKHQQCIQSSDYCSKARTGKNMAGIMSFMTNHYTDTYREYVTVPLKSYLRPNVKTYVEVWVRKGGKAKLVCNNIGFYFSKTAPLQNISTNLLLTPQYNHTAIVNQDSQHWEKITGSFIPKTPYKFLTIGNFYDNAGTDTATSQHHDMPRLGSSYAYYLLDDVRVWQEGDTIEVVSPYQLEGKQPIQLENVEFASNSAVLLGSSRKELATLVQFLKARSTLRIAIHGHTDNVGAADANLQLSTERAQMVVKFLVKSGIAAERLSAKGFGAEKPLVPNETPEGRAKNRRVEFVVLE